jgi:predicted ester cyclase
VKLKEYHQNVLASIAAFPDAVVTVEDIMGEGDKVVARIKMNGTHKGTYLGMAPTGKKFSIEAIGIYRIAGGRIAEVWSVSDALGMMQQIGAIPTPSKK